MQFRCMICNRIFWSYEVIYYKKVYIEDDDGLVSTTIDMSNSHGKYTENDICRFTDDGLPMIEVKPISNVKNCYTHRVNKTMESFL